MSATRFSSSSAAAATSTAATSTAAASAVADRAAPTLKVRLTALVDELVRQGLTLEQARKEFERQFICASIRDHEGNLCRSARSLGVHRNTLRNKLNDLGIEAGNGARSDRRGPRRLVAKR